MANVRRFWVAAVVAGLVALTATLGAARWERRLVDRPVVAERKGA